MLKVNNHYVLDEKTMAIEYAKAILFESIIHDVHDSYHSRQSSHSLINEACLERNSTYKTKLEISRLKYNHMKKPPCIICPKKEIYFIPTMSPTSIDNMWLNPRHVTDIIGIQNPILTFINGLKLSINCSRYTYEKQVERAKVQLYHYMLMYK